MSEARIALLVSVLSLLVSLSPRSSAETPVSSLPATCVVGDKVFLTTTGTNYWCTAANTWTAHSISGGGAVPTGSIVMVNSGSCPSGYTELTALAGLYPLGTTVANADAGTTGGSTSYTPAGSVAAPTFTGTAGTVPAETVAWPVGVPTNSTGTVTPTGTVAWPAGVPTINEPSFTITGTKFTTSGSGTPAASSFNGTTLGNGSNSVSNPAQAISWPAAVPAFSGTSSTTSAETISWPAGVPTNSTASFTPSGSNSAPGFTGTAATIQQPFEKVIFCKAP